MISLDDLIAHPAAMEIAMMIATLIFHVHAIYNYYKQCIDNKITSLEYRELKRRQRLRMGIYMFLIVAFTHIVTSLH